MTPYILAAHQTNSTSEYPNMTKNILKRLKILDIMQLQLEIADKDKKLYIVSDGGVYNYQSNFGAVIAALLSPLAQTYGKITALIFMNHHIGQNFTGC
jgi:hypothetical protein